MFDLDIIRPSSSLLASPLHMVPKKAPGHWRPCGDYCTVNTATVPDCYQIPHLQDFASIVAQPFRRLIWSELTTRYR